MQAVACGLYPPNQIVSFELITHLRMRCIHHQSPHLPSLLPHPKHQLATPKHLRLWLSSTFRPTPHHIPHPAATRPPRVLGDFDSPASTGDLSVLIPTSAVLLFAYWVTNFVVPDIISRYLGLDKGGEPDEKPDDRM